MGLHVICCDNGFKVLFFMSTFFLFPGSASIMLCLSHFSHLILLSSLSFFISSCFYVLIYSVIYLFIYTAYQDCCSLKFKIISSFKSVFQNTMENYVQINFTFFGHCFHMILCRHRGFIGSLIKASSFKFLNKFMKGDTIDFHLLHILYLVWKFKKDYHVAKQHWVHEYMCCLLCFFCFFWHFGRLLSAVSEPNWFLLFTPFPEFKGIYITANIIIMVMIMKMEIKTIFPNSRIASNG